MQERYRHPDPESSSGDSGSIPS